MERKYIALRIIATILKVFGIIVAGLTILSVLGTLGTGLLGGAAFERFVRELGQPAGGLGVATGAIFGLIATVFSIIVGGSMAMFLYAAGEAIYLQIDIEHNTRSATWYLEQLRLPAVPATAVALQPYPVQPVQEPVSLPNGSLKSYCPQCGNKVGVSDRYCSNCNFDLG